ncbi:MAG: sigma 54-interacting transcriptional regulator [Phycisphaerae bacterium]|nr:sigma 54-interacting transcriptional regulator [Phycisphaerae bacterium]
MSKRDCPNRIDQIEARLDRLAPCAPDAPDRVREALSEVVGDLRGMLTQLRTAEEDLCRLGDRGAAGGLGAKSRIGAHQLLQTILDSTHMLVAYMDPHFNFIQVNRAYAEADGREPSFFSGKNHFEIYPHAENEEIFRRVTETGEPYVAHAKPFEYAEHPERGVMYWDWTLIPTKDGEGSVTGLVLTLADVTQEERSDRALRSALADVRRRGQETAALLSASRAVLEHREFKPAARAIFEACRGVVGAEAGYVALLSSDGSENEVVFLEPGGLSCRVDPSLPMPIRGLRSEAYRTGKPVYENDFSRSDWVRFLPPGHAELSTVMFAPLMMEGKAIGLMGLANKADGFTERDAEVASAFADLAAVALKNAWTQESLAHSEERFRSVAQSATDAIITTSGSGDVVFWNEAAEQMFGYAPEEIMGKPVRLLLPEGHRERHTTAFEPILSEIESGRSGRPTELVGRRKSGEEFSCEVSLSAWSTREGTFFTGIVRDITQRKRGEARLVELNVEIQRSRDDMLSILNQLSLGTAMTDTRGRVTFLSKTAQRLLARTPSEVLGKHWEVLLSAQADEKVQLEEMCGRPPDRRERVLVHVQAPGRRSVVIDVVVHDDPREAKRKIFAFYDVSEVHNLRRMLDDRAQFHDLIGKSKPMQQVYQLIREVAKVDCHVLIEGESGTGKELVARAIHFAGHRKDEPFLAVNCAGLNESLLGSQLFGHRRGAFTGATENHKGLFEAADGGTLLLDEVGDIPLSVQANLLRVIQQKEILPLGETRPRNVDVRLIAATNRDLSREVSAKRFRLDLLYRIRVATIKLPPLRERREDIPLLVSAFLGKAATATGKDVREVSGEVLRVLMDHPWPGNVRELQSAIEFAVIRADGPVIRVEDLSLDGSPTQAKTPRRERRGRKSDPDEADRLMAALEEAQGNRSLAAQRLGISRATLYRRLAELGLTNKH